MASPQDTVALNDQWDSYADANGNIAIATGAAAVAQDMASACALFRGEYIFDVSIGVPYRTIFGYTIALAVIKSDFVAAASKIPGLIANSVVCYISAVADRCVRGQVQGKVVAASGVGTQMVLADIVPPIALPPTLTGEGGFPILTGGPGGPDLSGGP